MVQRVYPFHSGLIRRGNVVLSFVGNKRYREAIRENPQRFIVSSPKFCVDVEIFLKLWILLFHDWLRSLHRDRKKRIEENVNIAARRLEISL